MNEFPAIDFTRVFDIPGYQQLKFPQTRALNYFEAGHWKGMAIEALQQRINSLTAWFLDQNFRKGDCLAVIPKMGSPEWMIVDLAGQQAGLIIVPIHPTASTEEIEFILNETSAVICIAIDRSLFDKVSGIRQKLSSLKLLFHLEKNEADFFHPILEEEQPDAAKQKIINDRKNEILEDDVVAILYTSGTSGISKGAMLTHRNLVSNIKSILTLLPLQPGQRVLSFLPYSHIFERTSSYVYLAFGLEVYFSTGIENLTHDFKTIRPYFCTTVPRTLEKMYDYLLQQKEEKNKLKKLLITWAMELGEQYPDHQNPGIGYSLQLMVARLVILNRWRKGLGGNLRFMVVGAAALRPAIGKLFSAAGIQMLSGYGMTEASPYISANRPQPGLNRFGTVGIPVPGMEIRIDNPNESGEGEILIKGPNVMKGYFKRPDMTNEVLSNDGWFKTGDVGKMVDKRFLSITDRKKDIFKTSAGKYISPQPLENLFCTSPFIAQCLILGFNQPYVVAILVPHFSILKTWCDEQQIHWTSPQFMVHNIKVVQKFQQEVDRLNDSLQGFERVRKFILSDEEWTVESKDLTTSFKLKRNKLIEKYKNKIEKIYRNS